MYGCISSSIMWSKRFRKWWGTNSYSESVELLPGVLILPGLTVSCCTSLSNREQSVSFTGFTRYHRSVIKFKMRAVLLVFLFGCATYTSSAVFQQCSGGKSFEDLDKLISVSRCTKAPCRLRKRTQTEVTMRFTPEKEVKKLRNSVFASIAGIPFPFIGVDNTNACSNIFEVDGSSKANCPLKAGTEYLYKNNIDVLDIYPRVKVIVHWALTSENGDEICFEVPARITN